MEKQNIIKTIASLLELQEIDRQVMRLTKELENIPARIAQAKSSISELQKKGETIKEVIKKKQITIKSLDNDVESVEQQIAKLREQQLQLKSNEQYKAMSREIENYKAKKDELEDNQLVFMEELENELKNENAAREELEKFSKNIQNEIDILKKREDELTAKIAEFQKKRNEFASLIPPEIYDRYQRIITIKKDYALAQIENGTCGICHMKLPPHIIHETNKPDGLVFCSYCGRILFRQALPA
jgi:predicted  nucleic acid-binding Zn-ribbon protein